MARLHSIACLLLLMAGLMASGCATHPARVDCEGRLEPINLPASRAKNLPEEMPLSTDEEREAQ